MQTEEHYTDSLPIGPMALIPLESCKTIGEKINDYLVTWRKEIQKIKPATLTVSMPKTVIS